jgi:hypothetical protein
MDLKKFLDIVGIVAKFVPVGGPIIAAVTDLIALLGPIPSPITGVPLTEAEVHLAVFSAQTVWERIELATRPVPPTA